MQIVEIVVLTGFCLIAFLHLLGEFLFDKGFEKFRVLRYFTKPLLMPVLLVLYFLMITTVNWWVVVALTGGFLGDVFLMIYGIKENQLWLRVGLVSFLLGHVFYIVAFFILAGNFNHYIWWSIFLAIPFIVGSLIVQPKLTKHTGNMTVAVTMYIVVIALMGTCTTFLLGFGTTVGFIVLYIGAWMFVISDILNGIGKFVVQFKYERVLTMLTYILGQLMIVLGLVYI